MPLKGLQSKKKQKEDGISRYPGQITLQVKGIHFIDTKIELKTKYPDIDYNKGLQNYR